MDPILDPDTDKRIRIHEPDTLRYKIINKFIKMRHFYITLNIPWDHLVVKFQERQTVIFW
jgi:hypothetical protein